MKKILIIGFCLVLGFQANAKELILRDSVGIEKVGNKTFIIHQVDEKETLFGISRRYQVAVNQIVENNPQLSEGLKQGQRVRVPYISMAAVPEGSSIHKVAPGETMFSISKMYNVSVNELLSWNNLQGADLSVGQSLIIKGAAEKPTAVKAETTSTQPKQEIKATPAPVRTEKAIVTPAAAPSKPSPTIVESKPTPTNNATANLPGDWISHTVVQGETLFSISQTYNTKVGDILAWNGMGSNDISIGQKLKVGRESNSNVPVVTSTVPVVINNEKTNVTLNTNTSANTDSDGNTAYKNIKEIGLAEVIEGTGNHKKYLVLHKNAPVGTIMRVRNEENDITIFARVVGKLPETGDNSKLVVKLSKAAFDQLRAVNSRFPVEISY